MVYFLFVVPPFTFKYRSSTDTDVILTLLPTLSEHRPFIQPTDSKSLQQTLER